MQTAGVTFQEATDLLSDTGSLDAALLLAISRIPIDRPLMHHIALSYFLFRGLPNEYPLRPIRPHGSTKSDASSDELHFQMWYGISQRTW